MDMNIDKIYDIILGETDPIKVHYNDHVSITFTRDDLEQINCRKEKWSDIQLNCLRVTDRDKFTLYFSKDELIEFNKQIDSRLPIIEEAMSKLGIK